MIGGIGRDITQIAATEGFFWLIVLVSISAVAAIFLGRLRFFGGSALEWFAGLASVALVVAVTLLRDGLVFGFAITGLAEWSGDGFAALSRDPLRSSQFQLNVFLFVPAGIAWAWFTLRPVWTAAALGLGSLLVECIQAVLGRGASDVADVVANSIGALLGVGFAAMVGHAVGRLDAWSFRKAVWVLLGTLFVCVLAVFGLFLGAPHRQATVRNSLESEFSGTDRRWASELLETNATAIWESGADGGAEFSSGSSTTSSAFVVRYPAVFFSLQRCVFVTWTDDGVMFDNASGSRCSEFLG